MRPSARISGDIQLSEDFQWVGRGALKLLHALDHFGLRPKGHALDIGASTGGFTEVLLTRGAADVTALDVGHGQLAQKLRVDPRAKVLEGVNARALPPGLAPPDWITVDVSFISLRLVLPPAMALARPGAILIALVKPQFEAGPGVVGKGGIIRDPALHQRICEGIARFV